MAANAPKTPPTNVERAKNFLLYGFLISIGLHLAVGPFVKFQHYQTEEEAPQKVTVARVPTPPPTPPPTPTPKPTPPPTPPPKQTPPPKVQTPAPQQPKIKINTAKTESKSNTGPSENANQYKTGNTQGVPQGEGTAKPVPSAPAATPAPPPTEKPTPVPTPPPPTCANPNVEPRTVQAATPEMPALAQQQNITGTVQVVVSLDASSNIVGVSIGRSPSPVLNSAAIAAAKQSTFKTKIVNCKPVADQYLFNVVFDNQ